MERQKAAARTESPESATALTKLGVALNGDGRWAEAEQTLARAIEADADHTRAWVEYCRALYKQDGLSKAVEAAARGGPEVSIRYANTVILSDGATAAPHVRSVLSLLLEREPGNHLAARITGYTYDYEHNFTEARRWYERAVELQPDDTANLKVLAFLRAGSKRATCEDCARWFQDHPDHLDLEEAQRLYLRILEVDAGRTKDTIDACDSLRRLGSTAKEMARALIDTKLTDADDPPDAVRRNGLLKARDRLLR